MSLAEHEIINAPSPDSILSHCKGALLPMFTQAEATTLRLVCCEFKEAVEEYPWGEEASSVIYGKVKDWRKCFPNALCANLTGVDRAGYKEDSATGRGYYPDDVEDFQHLRGVRMVIMTRAFGLESGHLEQLSGVHTLILRNTSLLCIAFPKLEGLHTLDLGGCENIRERELVHLEGLHTLILRDCKDLSDRVFKHLPEGLHTLSVRRCEYLSDAVFEHLPEGLRALDVRGCHITDGAFLHFQHLHTLTLDCYDHFTQAAAEWLSMLKVLRVSTSNGRHNSGYFVHYVRNVGREVSIDFVSYNDD